MRGVSIIAFLLVITLVGGCVSQGKYLTLDKAHMDRGLKLANANKKLEVLNEDLETARLEIRAKEVLLKKREEELAAIRTFHRETITNVTRKNWKSELMKELESLKQDGFGINAKNGAIILNESVFFDKGSATLKGAARSALLKLGRLLKAKTGDIQINGHTDSDKVVKHRKTWPQGNIQLSGARAMAVLIFLRDQSHLRADRMAFAGYGPYQPLAPNNSDSNKRKNRRVEILLKDESIS